MRCSQSRRTSHGCKVAAARTAPPAILRSSARLPIPGHFGPAPLGHYPNLVVDLRTLPPKPCAMANLDRLCAGLDREKLPACPLSTPARLYRRPSRQIIERASTLVDPRRGGVGRANTGRMRFSLSYFGTCPSCGSRISLHDDRCLSCGETSFVKFIRRRAGNENCYDCKYNRRRIDPKCHRCHGYGYVVVYFSQSLDAHWTGERGQECRWETAPDTWEAENVS